MDNGGCDYGLGDMNQAKNTVNTQGLSKHMKNGLSQVFFASLPNSDDKVRELELT